MGRALIVEDNATLNAILNDFVEEMGFSVTSARDLSDARRAFEVDDYNLVVADLKLDGDTRAGLKLADELARQHENTRVVLVSGYPKPEELAPDITFLRKPF